MWGEYAGHRFYLSLWLASLAKSTAKRYTLFRNFVKDNKKQMKRLFLRGLSLLVFLLQNNLICLNCFCSYVEVTHLLNANTHSATERPILYCSEVRIARLLPHVNIRIEIWHVCNKLNIVYNYSQQFRIISFPNYLKLKYER